MSQLVLDLALNVGNIGRGSDDDRGLTRALAITQETLVAKTRLENPRTAWNEQVRRMRFFRSLLIERQKVHTGCEKLGVGLMTVTT